MVMKKTLLFPLLMAAMLSFVFTACDTRQGDRDDATTEERGTDTYTPGTEDNTGMRTETEREFMFFDDEKEYTYENRDEFRQDVQAARTKLDQEINRLETQSANVSSDAREEYREKINDLKETRDELDKDMKGFNRATADNWEEFESEVKSSWNDVEDTFKDVRDDVHEELEDVNEENRDQSPNP
jgi:dsDNA-specific endonuclease/ATPase MutS2/predicted small secreted protein